MHHEISPSVLVVLKINFMSAHLGLSKTGASPNAVVHHHDLRKLRDLQHGGFFGLPQFFGGQTHPQLVGGSHPDFCYTQLGWKSNHIQISLYLSISADIFTNMYMYTYIHTYIHTYIYIYMCVYINFQMDIIHIYIDTYIYIYNEPPVPEHSKGKSTI